VKPRLQALVARLVHVGWMTSALRALASRGLLPAALWRRLPTQQPIDVRLAHGLDFLWSGPEWATRPLFWASFVDEPETLRVWVDLAKEMSTIVDVGANLGTYTLAACAANPNATVHAFEPVPETAAQLRRNIAINGWERRARVDEAAVADHNGTVRFHVPGDFSPMASLDPSGFRGKDGLTITVRVGRLDDLVQNAARIELVKIDVEKFEPDVLRGMPRLLACDRPLIIIECLTDGPYNVVDEILRNAGYSFFHIGEHGPVRAPRIVPATDPHNRFRNYLAVAFESVAEPRVSTVIR